MSSSSSSFSSESSCDLSSASSESEQSTSSNSSAAESSESEAIIPASALYDYRNTEITSLVSSVWSVGRFCGIRVRFEVSHKVFAYRMLLTDPNTDTREGHFSHVCSVPDLADFPVDEPLASSSPEWFRSDVVDIVVRSPEEAADFIKVVKQDLLMLTTTIVEMEELTNPGFLA